MNQFEPQALQGFDAAKFNEQQYKMAHLQAWIEGECIRTTSELLKASSAIDGSYKTFTYVLEWALNNNKLES